MHRLATSRPRQPTSTPIFSYTYDSATGTPLPRVDFDPISVQAKTSPFYLGSSARSVIPFLTIPSSRGANTSCPRKPQQPIYRSLSIARPAKGRRLLAPAPTNIEGVRFPSFKSVVELLKCSSAIPTLVGCGPLSVATQHVRSQTRICLIIRSFSAPRVPHP